MTSLTPLRVRSHGSLLYGTASPERLVARALELGYRALALTDRDNLYLAIRFLKHARSEGLRPILGATVAAGHHEALLLPIDRRGYAHLCEILTHRRLDDGLPGGLGAVRQIGLSVFILQQSQPCLAVDVLDARERFEYTRHHMGIAAEDRQAYRLELHLQPLVKVGHHADAR